MSLRDHPIVNLFVAGYNEKDEVRAAELRFCLRANIKLQEISSVWIIEEDTPNYTDGIEHMKIKRVSLGRRLHFRDVFLFAENSCAGELVLLSNADIQFSRSLHYLNAFNFEGILGVASRYEFSGRSWLLNSNAVNSHDSWLFMSPIKHFESDWPMGILGCENRLCHEAMRANIPVVNFSHIMAGRHIHFSEVRYYTMNWMMGEYASAPFGNISKYIRDM